MSELDLDALEKRIGRADRPERRSIWLSQTEIDVLFALARRAADAERERDEALKKADREDRAHIRTLEERDAVQALFDELYEAFFGEGPEYSSLFNATDAFNAMDALLSSIKASKLSALSRLAALREKCAPFVSALDKLWEQDCELERTKWGREFYCARCEEGVRGFHDDAAHWSDFTHKDDCIYSRGRELALAVKEGE